ncbi:DUF1656 domain-containing protein [Anaeromyxobacter paludicola]|uniref:DUF1656 domain-containing protein n=1 Tax=Anaeromyxobacter paludicola TaxID=2918171 RepID=A0ABN6NEP1_9BACT|nr:DUF1656 domain-containing protein [Anaeromyxobacter paludicola]BDG10649.1 hypothetical protein AMPC_37620 [Anaeromyxobacter paludicola]
MPREIELFGLLLPTLLVAFHVAAVAFWLLDRALARAGLYRFVWHPGLFRVSLLTALFGLLGLAIYR